MKRLVLLVATAGALTHFSVPERLAEVRERQYESGARIGCQLRLARELAVGDVDRATETERACGTLGRG